MPHRALGIVRQIVRDIIIKSDKNLSSRSMLARSQNQRVKKKRIHIKHRFIQSVKIPRVAHVDNRETCVRNNVDRRVVICDVN